MSQEKFTNNAITTLGSSVSPTATTITLSAGSGALFPTLAPGDYFTGTIFAAGSSTGTPNEIVKVTNRSGDTLTVVRGQEGTSASTWNVGDTFANFPTAGFFNQTVITPDIQSQSTNSSLDSGVANQGIVTLDPAITSLDDIFLAPIRILKMNVANSNPYSLIVNGLSAKPVLLNGQALVAGQLVGGQVFEVVWDGTAFQLISNPSKIQNNQLGNMPAGTFKGNSGGSAAAPSDLPLSSLPGFVGFGSFSLTTNGYYTLPNGLIIQWGRTSSIFNEGSVGVTFPVAFPNACLNMIATIDIPSPSIYYDQGAQVIGTPGRFGGTLYLQEYDGSGHTYPVTAFWQSIGY